MINVIFASLQSHVVYLTSRQLLAYTSRVRYRLRVREAVR